MFGTLRLAIYDTSHDDTLDFCSPFERLPNVQIINKFRHWDDLQNLISQEVVDLVVINLDGDRDDALGAAGKVVRQSGHCAVLGVSSSPDPSTIIRAMRAGCSQFVCWPIDLEDLKLAISQIRATRFTARHASKRVCVVGASGGAGATTIACNLALELAHFSGQQSILVDLNLEFGDIACALDCTPKYSIADVCREGYDLDRAMLYQALHQLPCDVALLPRPEKLDDVSQIDHDNVERALRMLSEIFLYTVIDLPRYFTHLTTVAASHSSHVLIITQLGVPFVRNAVRVREALGKLGADLDRVEIVINRCQTGFDKITAQDVERSFGKPVFAMIPNDYKRVMNAFDMGHAIGADAPDSPVRLAIQKLARKIMGTDDPGSEEPLPGDTLLGKLFRRKQRV